MSTDGSSTEWGPGMIDRGERQDFFSASKDVGSADTSEQVAASSAEGDATLDCDPTIDLGDGPAEHPEELDYSSIPDPAAGRDLEVVLNYDALPDPASDPRDEPPDWDGSTVDRQQAGSGLPTTAPESGPVPPDLANEDLDAVACGTADQRVVAGAIAALDRRQAAGEVMGGDPINRASLWHEQGLNEPGYQADCALAATSGVLRDCGVDATEDDVVRLATANNLCDTSNAEAALNGGVRDGAAISELMDRYGVDSRVVNPKDPAELARWVEQGHGVVAEVNAGELWDGRHEVSQDAFGQNSLGESLVNHAVHVTGTTYNSEGDLTGFIINDSGQGDGAANSVPLERWDRCWTNTDNNHETVVTTLPTTAERNSRS